MAPNRKPKGSGKDGRGHGTGGQFAPKPVASNPEQDIQVVNPSGSNNYDWGLETRVWDNPPYATDLESQELQLDILTPDSVCYVQDPQTGKVSQYRVCWLENESDLHLVQYYLRHVGGLVDNGLTLSTVRSGEEENYDNWTLKNTLLYYCEKRRANRNMSPVLLYTDPEEIIYRDNDGNTTQSPLDPRTDDWAEEIPKVWETPFYDDISNIHDDKGAHETPVSLLFDMDADELGHYHELINESGGWDDQLISTVKIAEAMADYRWRVKRYGVESAGDPPDIKVVMPTSD